MVFYHGTIRHGFFLAEQERQLVYSKRHHNNDFVPCALNSDDALPAQVTVAAAAIVY